MAIGILSLVTHNVRGIFQKKMGTLVAQINEFHACLMVLGSNPQVSFIEHRFPEQEISSLILLVYISSWGMCSHDSLSLNLFHCQLGCFLVVIIIFTVCAKQTNKTTTYFKVKCPYFRKHSLIKSSAFCGYSYFFLPVSILGTAYQFLACVTARGISTIQMCCL